MSNGTQHKADALALQAQTDLTAAYTDAAGRTPATTVSTDLGGRTLAPGVYKSGSALGLTGTVTLDAQGDPNAVFIFQAGSTLITASSSRVRLIGGASPCNVLWQVGSSATLGTDTRFVGSILALTSVTVQTRTRVAGRVLARNGAVTLDNNRITRPACATPSPTPTATPNATASPTPTTVIPSGHPETGAGGAAHPCTGVAGLMAVGAMALVAACAAMGRTIRRQRGLPTANGPGHSELAGDE